MNVVTRTLRLKVKRGAYAWLNAAAVEVNQVWNYCNETSYLAATRTDRKQKWLTGFDLGYLTAGATKFFEHIGAHTINRACHEYASRRRAAKRTKLRWRVSFGARRSLGWVPFRSEQVKRKGNCIRFSGKSFRTFEQHRLHGVKWLDGCFAQDALGDWWLCLPVEVHCEFSVAPCAAAGLDLGLRDAAVTSDGDRLSVGCYRDIERRISGAQRRGHKRHAKRLHRKAARRRADALHKFTRKVVDQYQHIVVGGVSSSKLARTRMAKSVHDAGWYMLKTQLQYKGEHAGRTVEVVNEAFTTRACSQCGALSGPQGLRQLVVREWTCAECGAAHDRDINAARNILALRCRASVSGNERPIAVAA